jgi:hypothetical protein
MARNAGELRYFVVLSGQPAGPEFGHLPGYSPIFFDGQGGKKFPKALFGTQRSPVQIRAARLESPWSAARDSGAPEPSEGLARKWRRDFPAPDDDFGLLSLLRLWAEEALANGLGCDPIS